MNKPFPPVELSILDTRGNYKKQKINELIDPQKLTIIVFWMFGCPPCVAEAEALSQLPTAIRRKFNLITVSQDTGRYKNGRYVFGAKRKIAPNQPLSVDYFTSGYDADHYAILAKEMEKSLHFYGYPLTLILDKKGIVRFVQNGGLAEPRELIDFLTDQVVLFDSISK